MNNPAERKRHCKFIKESCEVLLRTELDVVLVGVWTDHLKKFPKRKCKHFSELVDFED